MSRDCAPWDGAAFTIQIPFDNGELLTIGIWRAPDIAFYESFQFPDHTGRKGYVQLIHPAGLTESLTGRVWFAGVGEELPIEGGFSLRSERGAVLEGRFQAQWETHWVLCR